MNTDIELGTKRRKVKGMKSEWRGAISM